MKNNKTALYAIAFILIGGLLASPSMQIGTIAYAGSDDEFESPTTHSNVDIDVDDSDSDAYDDSDETKEYDHKKMGTYEDHREMADRWCTMTEEEKEAHLDDHEEMREYTSKHEEYCQLDEAEKEQYIRDRMAEMRDMKTDYMKDGMDRDYVRDFNMRIAAMCDMSDEAKRKAMAKYEFLQEHHERIAEYCNMSAEEREKYRMTHQDMMEDFREDMPQMRDKMMDGQNDMRMKMMHDKMRDYDMSDERRDALKEKFKMHYSDKSDVERDEMIQKFKSKYMQHFKSDLKMRHDAMSDLQRDQILQRIAEMRDYKADLREKYQDMTEDERVEFQADFRDKVSDKRFAWISPHKQMLAGVAVDELECREGLNLVLKSSNGKAMCVKSATAERLIENGLAVPAA
jgi:hypothetical protein